MTSRYEPKIQAFGLEPKACSRYGWEFFLCFVWGFSSLFEASPEKLESRFPGILISGKISIIEDFRVSHFVLGFLDPRSKFSQPRTTKGFDSVRVGTRMTTNDDESRESFSNSSNESVFFRSEKAEDF